MNPYEVLGVAPDEQAESIKLRYRALVRENHPDLALNEAQRTLFGQRMRDINHAWAIVGDPQQRAAFDARRRLEELEKRATPKPQTPPRPAPAQARSSQVKSQPGKTSPRETSRAKGAGQTTKKSAGKNQSPKTEQRLRLERAFQLFREGRPDEAIAICHRVLRLDYRNVSARELLADIHLSRGEGNKAVLLWEQISLLRPQNPEFRARYQTLRSRVENARTEDQTPPAPKPSAKTPAPKMPPDWQSVPVVKPIPRPQPKPKKGIWGFLRAKLRR